MTVIKRGQPNDITDLKALKAALSQELVTNSQTLRKSVTKDRDSYT